MSVCTFGPEELANVAAAIIANRPTYFSPDSIGEDINAACAQLALVSEANVACFKDRYGTSAALSAPCTADEIKEAFIALEVAPGACEALRRAIGTVQLLHYNCADQGGDFTIKISGAHEALINILTGLMLALARKAGVE